MHVQQLCIYHTNKETYLIYFCFLSIGFVLSDDEIVLVYFSLSCFITFWSLWQVCFCFIYYTTDALKQTFFGNKKRDIKISVLTLLLRLKISFCLVLQSYWFMFIKILIHQDMYRSVFWPARQLQVTM